MLFNSNRNPAVLCEGLRGLLENISERKQHHEDRRTQQTDQGEGSGDASRRTTQEGESIDMEAIMHFPKLTFIQAGQKESHCLNKTT